MGIFLEIESDKISKEIIIPSPPLIKDLLA